MAARSGHVSTRKNMIASLIAASRRHRSVILAAIAAAGLGAVASAHAAVATWDGSVGNLWSSTSGTDSNWTGGTGTNGLPNSGDSLVFTATTGVGGTSLMDDLMTPATYTIAGITFNSGAANFTLGPSTPGTNGFTLGGNIVNNSSSGSVQTIGEGIVLSAARTISTNTNTNLIISGNISGAFGLTINPTNNNANSFVTLTGSNTYTGNTTIGYATVNINSANALGTGNIRTTNNGHFDNTSGDDTLTLAVNGLADDNGAGGLFFNGTNSLTFGGNNTFNAQLTVNATGSNSKNLTLNGTSTMLASTTFTVNNSGSLILNGVVNWSSFQLQKSGSGTLVLNNANIGSGLTTNTIAGVSYSTTLRVNAGTVAIGNKQAFSTGVVDIRSATLLATTDLTGDNKLTNTFVIASGGPTIGGNGNIEFGGQLIQSNGASTTTTLTINNTGSTKFSGNISMTDVATADNQTLVVSVPSTAGPVEISGTIQNSSVASSAIGSFTKSGNGLLTLSGTSTYTGTTTVSGGKLNVTGALGATAISITGGTLSLSGTGNINASTGITINGAGAKFLQTGSVASTAYINLNNGTIDGIGKIGDVAVASNVNSVIANGNNSTASLTLNSLTFSGAATTNLTIAGGGNGASAPLFVTNALNTSGTPSTVIVNLAPQSPLVLGATYNLIGYGSFNGQTTDFVKGTNFGGLTARQITFGNDPINKFITVTYSSAVADKARWTGGDDSTWQANLVGANKNWNLSITGTATDYITSDDVIFDDSATGPGGTFVSIPVDVNPSSVTFSNNAKTYTISGPGAITGIGTSLTVNGTGMVILTNTNTYTGATTISSGTLQLGDGITDGSIASTSAITNNGKMIFNVITTSPTYTAPISGTGSITTSGFGTLVFASTASSTYSGGTTIAGGTLQLNVSGATNTVIQALGTGPVTINPGTTLNMNSGGTSVYYLPNSLVIDGGTVRNMESNYHYANDNAGHLGTITVTSNGGTIIGGYGDSAKDSFFDGQVVGSGPLTLSDQGGSYGGPVAYFTNPTNLYSGTISTSNANEGAAAGIGANAALSHATINVVDGKYNLTSAAGGSRGAATNNSGIRFATGVTAPVIAALTGTGPVYLQDGEISNGSPVFLSVGNDNVSSTFAGIAAGSGGFTKVGSGTFTLTGVNTYTGVTTVSNGTLQLGDGITDGSVAGPIANNAVLAFNMTGARTLAGVISGTGVMNVLNTTSGKTVLTASNSFSGPVMITSGTLIVGGSGSLNNAASIAINGPTARYLYTSTVPSDRTITLTQGTLDGTGTLGTVNVGLGGSVANGNGTASALTIGTLNFNGGGAFSLLSAGGSTTSGPLVKINGTLSTPNMPHSVTINLSPLAPFVSGSTYDLLSYGNFSGSLSDFVLGSGLSGRFISGSSFSNDTVNKIIKLTVNGDTPVWSGANGGIWKTQATNSPTSGTPNWALKTAHTTTDFWVSDNVEFNDTVNIGGVASAPTTTEVVIQGGVSPAVTTFNNNTLDYTITSYDNTGINSGSLFKNGTGTVIIATSNTYTGTTSISAGTLQIGNGSTWGATIASSSNIVNNGRLIFNIPDTQTYANVISGSGSLTLAGYGTLILNAANTYTGGTTINGGTLQMGNASALGPNPGMITFDPSGNGTLELNGNSLTVDGLNSGPYATVRNSVPTNITMTVNGNTDTSFGGAIQENTAGKISLIKNGTGTFTLGGYNSYTGATSVTGGTLAISGALGATAITVSGGILSLQSSGAINANTITFTGSGALDETADYAIGGTTAMNIQSNVTIARPNSHSGQTTFGASGVSLTLLDPNAAGTGQIFTEQDGVGIKVHVNGGSVYYVQNAVHADRISTINFDVNNNGDGSTGGVVRFTSNVQLGDTGTETVNVTGGNGYSLVFDQVSFNNWHVANLAFNPTTASVSLGSYTGPGDFDNTLILDGTANGNAISGAITELNGHHINLTKSNTSTWTIYSNSITGVGTISGGTLRAGNYGIFNAASAVNVTGGTFDMAGFDQNIPALSSSAGSVITTQTNGVATLTTGSAGTNTVIAGFLRDGTAGQVLAFTKEGNGTVTLSASNTYSGATTVNGGKLIVNGSLPNSTVTVSVGGIDGTGSIKAAVIGDAASNIVANGNGSTASLTVGSLTFNGAATLNLKASPSGPALKTTTLTANGAPGSIIINPTSTSWLSNQMYHLVSFTGSIGGTGASAFVLGAMSPALNPARQTGASLSYADAGFISLIVTGDNPVWSGNKDGIWSTSPTGDNSGAATNWATQVAHANTNFWAKDDAQFNDTVQLGAVSSAPATTNIAIQGGVTPNSVTFNNSALAYTVFSNDGTGIGGTSGLIKNGTAPTIIQNANSFTGQTIVNAGTLNLQNSAALGASSMATVANGAALELQGGIAITQAIPLVLNGAGLAANPAGALRNVSGNNTYSGLITLGSSTTIQSDSTGESLVLSNTGSITGSGANLTLAGAGNGTLAGTIDTGNGTLTKTGTGTWRLTGRSTFTGGTVVNSGILELGAGGGTGTLRGTLTINNGGTVRTAAGDALGYNDGAQTTKITINAGGVFDDYTGGNQGYRTQFVLNGGTVQNTGGGSINFTDSSENFAAPQIVTVAGSSSVFSAGISMRKPTFNIDMADSSTLLVSGGIGGGSSTGSFLKTGSGKLILSGANTFANPITNSAGTLQIGNGGTTGSVASTSIINSGVVAFNRSDALTLAAAISGTGSVSQIGPGSTILTTANSYSGGTTVNSGALVFASAAARPNGDLLSINSGLVGTATLGGKVVVAGDSANLASYVAAIAAAYNGGAWNGASSITTSTGSGTRGLGYMDGNTWLALNGGSGANYAVGYTIAATDMLIRYTYMGDADLSGAITLSDYAQIDAAFLFGAASPKWSNGDFNYDGVVNYKDYAIIDASFAAQSGPLANDEIALHTAQFGDLYVDAFNAVNAAAVPEPASLALLGIGAAGLMARRRRSK